jgi:tetratricopeptide (TPR) repeat protein
MIGAATASTRDADLRLARLHLRTGLLALARAELEAAAGRGALDREGLADLAEARWRTGDLIGAGLAAEAHLGQGGEALVALVVAAEYRFVEGRIAEAEEAARAAAAAGPTAVRALFAGLPAGPIWEPILGSASGGDAAERRGEAAGFGSGATGVERPGPAVAENGSTGVPATAAGSPAVAGSSAVAGSPAAGTVFGGVVGSAGRGSGHSVGIADSVGIAGGLGRAAGPTGRPMDVDRWLAIAREALADGRIEAGVAALGLALRFDPAAAETVLDILAGLEGTGLAPADPPSAGLEVLRGDALHLVGREAEARAAYRRAGEALRPSEEG